MRVTQKDDNDIINIFNLIELKSIVVSLDCSEGICEKAPLDSPERVCLAQAINYPINFNEILAIKEYFGITNKKPNPIKSVNQEIYKQLRNKLDTSMRDYKVRLDKGEAKKII
jgi:hypothetical protein